MPITNVIAIKDYYPYFIKGDKAKIVPILYEEDTVIVNELYGVFDKNDKFCGVAEKRDFNFNSFEFTLKKISDNLYAEKGTYKDSYIEFENGSQYPSSIVRSYEDYFEKV